MAMMLCLVIMMTITTMTIDDDDDYSDLSFIQSDDNVMVMTFFCPGG